MAKTCPFEAAERFNQRYRVGDLVRYWPAVCCGTPQTGRLQAKAAVLGGRTAVAWISGAKSCVRVDHIAPAVMEQPA